MARSDPRANRARVAPSDTGTPGCGCYSRGAECRAADAPAGGGSGSCIFDGANGAVGAACCGAAAKDPVLNIRRNTEQPLWMNGFGGELRLQPLWNMVMGWRRISAEKVRGVRFSCSSGGAGGAEG